MEKSTLVVLEKGNDCAFEGTLAGCCALAIVSIV